LRRETYPSSGLEGLLKTVEIVGEETLDKDTIKDQGGSLDSLRLAEILGALERIGLTNRYYRLTDQGRRLLHACEEERKIRLFVLLMRDNRVLPQYFKRLVDNEHLQNKSLNTNELSKKLSMEDQWSADILNEWCRFLGISIGRSKTDVFLSSEEVKRIRVKAFLLVLQEQYQRLSGSSGLVPVSRLRRELNDSGILSTGDDFDSLLARVVNAECNRSKVTFQPAPAGLVGQGLLGTQGMELVCINGSLDG